jgi:hypothetical protein
VSTFEPEQLLQLWKLDQIDSEMAIGHLLQHIVAQQTAMKKMNGSLQRFQLDLDNLRMQIKLNPPGKQE